MFLFCFESHFSFAVDNAFVFPSSLFFNAWIIRLYLRNIFVLDFAWLLADGFFFQSYQHPLTPFLLVAIRTLRFIYWICALTIKRSIEHWTVNLMRAHDKKYNNAMRMKWEINSGHKNAILSKWFSYVSYLVLLFFCLVWFAFALAFHLYRVNKVDSLYEMLNREKMNVHMHLFCFFLAIHEKCTLQTETKKNVTAKTGKNNVKIIYPPLSIHN